MLAWPGGLYDQGVRQLGVGLGFPYYKSFRSFEASKRAGWGSKSLGADWTRYFSRILCAFKCQYHRFTRPSKNGERENQKMNE
jgi:hypothetical protein